jgi:hypothetical protein
LQTISPQQVPFSGATIDLECQGIETGQGVSVKFIPRKGQEEEFVEENVKFDRESLTSASTLTVTSPSFRQYGVCDVDVYVSFNGQVAALSLSLMCVSLIRI